MLGGFGLRVGGRDVAASHKVSRKARALLAYLAINPGQHASREAVSDLLWTRRGAEQARHSLRMTLVELRRVFAAEGIEPLQADNGSLRLAPERVAVDTARLRHVAGGDNEADWGEADRLYAGPFLDRFPAVSPGFDDWLTQERSNWMERALEAMGRLADARLGAGDVRTAVTLCERMLSIDPLREDNHRRLMTAYAAAGRRADAVRQYHACVAMLRQDLDVGPSRDTEALFQRLRTGNDRPAETPRGFREERVRGPEPQPLDGPPWIAVLPFRVIGSDLNSEYFVDGLVEDIVCVLAAAREPIVISTNSTRNFRNTHLSLAEIGNSLNVRYAVSGSVRLVGTRLRLAVELADTTTGGVLWRSAYDAVDPQQFDDHLDIAANIAGILVPQISQNELRRVLRKPTDMGAYHLMLRARELIFRLDRASFEEAGELLRRALSLDPNFAPIHVTLADWYSLRIWQGWSADPDEDTRVLDRVARTAIGLDPVNARALAILGHNRTILEREYDEAIRLFDRALAAVPNDAETLMWSSPTFAYVGEANEAVRRAERAIALSPSDPFLFRYQHFASLSYYSAGSYDAAVHWGLRSMQGNPHYTSNLRFTAASLVALGRVEEARPLVRRVMESQPDFRVKRLIARQPFRSPAQRERYGEHLIEAGLPP